MAVLEVDREVVSCHWVITYKTYLLIFKFLFGWICWGRCRVFRMFLEDVLGDLNMNLIGSENSIFHAVSRYV